MTKHESFCLLLDLPADGAWNMAVDETLLEEAAETGRCTLRFYRWAEPTLSLGYFQACADRARHPASSGAAVVRRLSGGGAILHDFDVTYSLTIPQHHPLAAERLRTYRLVHEALIEVLAGMGIRASLVTAGASGGSKEPFLCFQRRAAGDVLVEGEKIAGSAQRRRRGAVLQHGSVLLARSPAAPELPGLKELTAEAIPVEEFIGAWADRLSATVAVVWQRGGLSAASCARAAQLVREKYACPDWTLAR